jgi:integrase
MPRNKPRRAKGEGSIYERRNAAGELIGYEGSIEIDAGTGGKRRRRKATGKTKTDVANKLRELKRQAEAGVDLGTQRQTVKQFLDHWLGDVVSKSTAPKTWASYEETCRNYILPHVGHIRLDALKQKQCQTMYDKLLIQTHHRTGKPLAPRTAEYAVKVLQRALNRAIREKLIVHNPAALVVTVRSAHTVQALSQESARAFLRALAGHRLAPLFWTLILTGMRRGEALALLWDDIDFTGMTITITKNYQRVRGVRIVGDPKNKSTRTIPLSTALAEILTAHRAQQGKDRTASSWREHGLVFPSTVGTYIIPGNLHDDFKTLLKRAGLPETTRLHDLRHTCATLLLDAGVNPANVAAQLGHAKVSTTLDVYGHSVPSSQAEGLEALGEAMRGEE